MSDEQNIQSAIKSTFDPSGTNAAKDAFDKVSEAAKGTAGEAKNLGANFLELAEALGVVVALEKLVDFLGEATREFYENEKALRSVTTAAQQFGTEAPKVTKEVEEWSEAMGRLAGVSNDEIMRAMGQQITLTGNVDQAYSRVGLALDYAAAKGVSFAEGENIVNAAIHGKTRALVGAIPGVTRHTQATEAQRLASDYLEKSIRGASVAVNDNAKAAAQAEERWRQLKEQIGGSVAPVITELRNVLLTIPRTLTLISDLSVVWADSVGRNFQAVVHLLGNLKTPIAAWKVFQAERTADELVTDGALKRAYEQNAKEFAQNEAAKTDAAKKGADKRLEVDKLELKAKEKIQRTFVESDWKQFLKDKDRREKAEKLYRKNVLKMQEDTTADVLRYFGIEESGEELKHHKALALLREMQKIKKEAAKQEMEMQFAVANAGIGLATEVFGQTKEVAIATAIVSTYQAAAGQLGMVPVGPWNIALAALMIVSGLAQVANIMNTSPATSGVSTSGSGFDDPGNDAAARQGGRRWANDMIREFSSGVSAGWASGMAGGNPSATTNNNSNTTNNYNVGGIVNPNDREWMKQFARKIALVQQSESQRTIARKT